jgi:hypothetical protein
MKTIEYNRKINFSILSASVRIFFLLVSFVGINDSMFAQNSVAGPFSYDPLEYTWRWNSSNPAVVKNVNMSNLPSLAVDSGLLVKFEVSIDPFEQQDLIQMIYDGVTKLSFTYSVENQLVEVKRHIEGSMTYDYPLYDKLFDYKTWEHLLQVKFYFTKQFTLIAVKEVGTNNNYLSPLFFGLGDQMRAYLEQSPLAAIKVGGNPSGVVSNLEIRSFKYARTNINDGDPSIYLLRDIRTRFQ